MKTIAKNCLYLWSILLVLFLNLTLLPTPASSEEAYVFERMWPTLQQPWYFGNPVGIAIDDSGLVYVADNYNHRIQKFTKDGQFVSTWGGYGSGDGQFNEPMGIAIDPDGFVYVVDSLNDRIQKFTKNGEFVSTWGSPGIGDGRFFLPWGIAIDPDGLVYVADSYFRIQKFTKDGQFVSTWGSYGSGDGQFNEPRGIAINTDGFVYVVDSLNSRIQKFTKDGQFVSTWGSYGSGDGQFNEPRGIAINTDGLVYVVDNENNRIQKFTSDGKFVAKWGSWGHVNGQFKEPMGIAIDPDGLVYVADSWNQRIQKFTKDGQFLSTWVSEGSGDGQFNVPWGIAIDTDGLVYVADSWNHRIQKFTKDGQFVSTWGGYGSGDGQFNEPMGIAIDPDGFVYVVDSLNDRIQKFTKNGEFVSTWGSPGIGDGRFFLPWGIAIDPDGLVYVADSYFRIQKFTKDGQFVSTWGSYGSGDGQFNEPMGIAIDPDGFVYVVDSLNSRIQKFTKDGQFVSTWGSYGSGDGHFNEPMGIAIDTDGLVYVADRWNQRIQKFTSDGKFVDAWGSLGSDPGQFGYPLGLCISEDGRIYVTDYYYNRIQVFKKETIHVNNKAIIVAGGGPYPENNIWEATEMLTNLAYRTMTYLGFTKDSIYYLSSATNFDYDRNGILDDLDGDATNSNLNYAITTWAQDAENLFIYMVGHGKEATFQIGDESEYLKAEDLDTWLDTLQETIPGNVTLLYDACHSGSFLPILDPPSGKERILVTSTSKNEVAIVASQGTNSFSCPFWVRMFAGDSFYDSFFHAKDSVGITYPQHPQLEGNGNGIGNEKEDKDIVRSLTIGNEIKSTGDIPLIGSVSPAQTIDGVTSALIYAQDVSDEDGISRVWAVITPPGHSSGSPDNPVTDLPTFDLSPAGDNRYEGTYNNFTTAGTYNIAIFASDRGLVISLPKATTVTVLHDYSSDIYEEDDTSNQANVINLNGDPPQHHNFHDTGDRDWVKFYGIAEEIYEIEVTNPGDRCDAVIELYDTDGTTLLKGPRDDYREGEDELMDWRCTRDGIYYVMIKHYEPGIFGDDTEYDLKIFRPIAAYIGFIEGIITNASSGNSIAGAVITTNDNASALSLDGGAYLIIHPAGSFTVTANAPGYIPSSYANVQVNEGGTTTRPFTLVPVSNGNTPDGDVAPLGNRDGAVTVGDALVALRFALGLETPTQDDIAHGDAAPLGPQGQPNPDGAINVGDALVILRKALGLISF
jgi:DNA-binding beta-propeller fold protein YncE